MGPVVAGTVIGAVGDVTRFPDRDHFAAYNGTAPIEVSSGPRKIYRLSRRGNRRLNTLSALTTVCLAVAGVAAGGEEARQASRTRVRSWRRGAGRRTPAGDGELHSGGVPANTDPATVINLAAAPTICRSLRAYDMVTCAGLALRATSSASEPHTRRLVLASSGRRADSQPLWAHRIRLAVNVHDPGSVGTL